MYRVPTSRRPSEYHSYGAGQWRFNRRKWNEMYLARCLYDGLRRDPTIVNSPRRLLALRERCKRARRNAWSYSRYNVRR